MKKCSKCNIKKSIKDFHKDKTRKDGLHHYCKLCTRLNHKNIYQLNKENIKIYNKKYYDKNRKKIIKHNGIYWLNRRKLYIECKILDNLRKRINNAIKNNYKSIFTMQLIGCSIDQLKKYLELKFKSGMNWNNYGKYGWHIDHIRPCASFDLTKSSEQKRCFHYTNLQPLWAKENLSKGRK
jgi:hypothetical protein